MERIIRAGQIPGNPRTWSGGEDAFGAVDVPEIDTTNWWPIFLKTAKRNDHAFQSTTDPIVSRVDEIHDTAARAESATPGIDVGSPVRRRCPVG